MKTLFLTLILFAQQATGTLLSLHVLDADQEALIDITTSLTLYTQQGQKAVVWFEESCQTDLDGACVFEIESPPPDGGILRGTLKIGDFGVRDVTWPGGPLKLTIPTEQIGVGREAAPYEFQAEDGGVAVVQGKNLPLYALLILLLLAGLLYFVYQKSRKEHL
jgi:hypothetical protein